MLDRSQFCSMSWQRGETPRYQRKRSIQPVGKAGCQNDNSESENRWLLFILIYMRKKMEKGAYALASSSISDIPVPLSSGQGEYSSQAGRDLKQSSSLYLPYNQQQSRGEESINLNFSTARPFYDEIAEEYYSHNQIGQKQEYNIQQKRVSQQNRSAFQKSPNKRIMVYSYSNVFSLNKIIEALIKKIKKRTFRSLNQSVGSFHTVEQRSQSHYRGRRGLQEERAVISQARRKAVEIIDAWLCYQILREKRRVMGLIITCFDQKRSSLSLSQSLRISHGADDNHFFTGFRSSNEISITQGLPPQIQESLVYTLQNQDPSRKETTESTLEKLPTEREETYSAQIKRDSPASASSDKSTPVYKLKALTNSSIAVDATFSISRPLPLFQERAPFPLKQDRALNEVRHRTPEHCFKEGHALLPDVFDKSKKEEDRQFELSEGVWEQAKRKRFEESARYSQVSNYHLDNSKNRQETYYIKTNFAYRPPFQEDRTVVKSSSASPFLSARVIRNELTATSSQQISSITTPKFTSKITGGSLHDIKQPRRREEKPIHQLQNDRIRIFESPRSFRPQAMMQPGINWRVGSNTPILTFQEGTTSLRNHSPLPNTFRPMQTQTINGSRQNAFTNQHAYPQAAQHPHQNTVKASLVLNQRMRTQAIPIVYYQSPSYQREPTIRLKRNEGNNFTHSPNMVNRLVSPQPQVRNYPSPMAIIQKMPYSSQDRGNHPPSGSPALFKELLNPSRQMHPQQLEPNLIQPNQYELELREKRQIRVPERRVALQGRIAGIEAGLVFPPGSSRAKSSASSPKLLFNYQSARGEEGRALNNLTKNSSEISRPKSMNSKLHITLKHKA